MQVSDRMADALRSTREALDAATNLCWCFLALSVISAAAFYDEPGLWWLCGCGLVLAAVAYKGAITAAQTYSGLMHVVYDLHRFDLVEALHLRLPDDPPHPSAGKSIRTTRTTRRNSSPSSRTCSPAAASPISGTTIVRDCHPRTTATAPRTPSTGIVNPADGPSAGRRPLGGTSPGLPYRRPDPVRDRGAVPEGDGGQIGVDACVLVVPEFPA